MFKQYMAIMSFLVIGGNLLFANSGIALRERTTLRGGVAIPFSEKMTLEACKNDIMYLEFFFEGALEGCGESGYAIFCTPSRVIPCLINKIPEAMKEIQLKLNRTESVLFMADPILFVNETLKMSARLDEFDQVYQEALSTEESVEKAWRVFSKYFNDAFAEAARQYMLELAHNSSFSAPEYIY